MKTTRLLASLLQCRGLDLEDLGQHYPPTLLAWDANVRRAAHRLPYDQRFFRTWHFYLTCLAGVFRAGDLALCPLVYGDYARMSRTGAPASSAAVPGGTMA
jgi:cyclopropane fatty-acyl-phospholipid synthase-like methyltransferase